MRDRWTIPSKQIPQIIVNWEIARSRSLVQDGLYDSWVVAAEQAVAKHSQYIVHDVIKAMKALDKNDTTEKTHKALKPLLLLRTDLGERLLKFSKHYNEYKEMYEPVLIEENRKEFDAWNKEQEKKLLR